MFQLTAVENRRHGKPRKSWYENIKEIIEAMRLREEDPLDQ